MVKEERGQSQKTWVRTGCDVTLAEGFYQRHAGDKQSKVREIDSSRKYRVRNQDQSHRAGSSEVGGSE